VKEPATISARRLHHTAVKLRDKVLMGASVFPMFDRQGTVWKVMVTWRGSSRILMLDYAPGRFTQNWWGIVVDASLAEERPLTPGSMPGLARLWHFDPWWVLREPRYGGGPELDILRKTNLSGRTPLPVYRLNFEGDLSRVRSVATERIGRPLPFDPAVLPEHQVRRRRSRRAGKPVWRLEKLW
jgi:hypothetical protein